MPDLRAPVSKRPEETTEIVTAGRKAFNGTHLGDEHAEQMAGELLDSGGGIVGDT